MTVNKYIHIAGFYFGLPKFTELSYLSDEKQSKIQWNIAKHMFDYLYSKNRIKPINNWNYLTKTEKEQILTVVFSSESITPKQTGKRRFVESV